MKKTARNFAMVAVFAMALTGLSLAQNPAYRVTANIPFDFNVGSQHLPAGAYMFEVEYDSPVVRLRNIATGRVETVLSTRDGRTSAGAPVVVFDVVGDAHLLADLKTSNAGVDFPEDKTMLASVQHKGSVAIVASLR